MRLGTSLVESHGETGETVGHDYLTWSDCQAWQESRQQNPSYSQETFGETVRRTFGEILSRALGEIFSSTLSETLGETFAKTPSKTFGVLGKTHSKTE